MSLRALAQRWIDTGATPTEAELSTLERRTSRLPPLYEPGSGEQRIRQCWRLLEAVAGQPLGHAGAVADLETCLSLWDYWLPFCQWVQRETERRRGPLFIGMGGPVAAGKSTVAELWVRALGELGIDALRLSLDDFYDPSVIEADRALAVPRRGPPGTHDIGSLRKTLKSLKSGDSAVTIPRFDKGAADGRGTLRHETTESAPDVVLVEGWLVGLRPDSPRSELASYDEVWSELDLLCFLWPGDPSWREAWRIDAESRRRDAGGGGMSPDTAAAFSRQILDSVPIESFLQAVSATGYADLVFELDEGRQPARAYSPAAPV